MIKSCDTISSTSSILPLESMDRSTIPKVAAMHEDHALTSDFITTIHVSSSSSCMMKNNASIISLDSLPLQQATKDLQRHRTLTSESIESKHSFHHSNTIGEPYNSISPRGEEEEDYVQATVSPTFHPLSQPQLPTSIEVVSMSCRVCSICLEEFISGENVRILPRCGHIFHLECIVPWLTEHVETCPLYKIPLFHPSMDSA